MHTIGRTKVPVQTVLQTHIPGYPRRCWPGGGAPGGGNRTSKSGATSGTALAPTLALFGLRDAPVQTVANSCVAACIRALGFLSRFGRPPACPSRRCFRSSTSLKISLGTRFTIVSSSPLLGRSRLTLGVTTSIVSPPGIRTPLCGSAFRGTHILDEPGPVRTERLNVPCLRKVE